MKIYESKLLLEPANGNDLFDDFIKAVHAKFTSPNGIFLDQIDDRAKDHLKLFLSDPDAGSPWKVGFQGTPPESNWARGNLIELDAAKHGKYKDYVYLDELVESGGSRQEAVDFKRVTEQGTEFVQETSTSSTSDVTLGRLEDKLNKAVDFARNKGGNKATLDIHILEGREHNYQDLIDLAEQISTGPNAIQVQVVLTPKKYAGWLVE